MKKKEKVVFIAEAGVNHNGDMAIAKELIDVAYEAKADYVKFQSFIASELTSNNLKSTSLQEKYTNTKDQLTLLKKLELSFDQFDNLSKYANDLGIGFLSTPFDLKSLAYLFKLNLDYIKVSSGSLTDFPLLEAISKKPTKVILSTGMSTIDEINNSLNILKVNGFVKEIILLHCVSLYPTPFSSLNLKSIPFLKEKFNCKVGFSDHSIGIEGAIAAVSLGADFIEKHFTLDKTMNGPDHFMSIDPIELRCLIKSIRNIEVALGNFDKKPNAEELINQQFTRKFIVASKKINKGEFFSNNNLTTKRSGFGIPANRWNDVIGIKSKYNFKANDVINI